MTLVIMILLSVCSFVLGVMYKNKTDERWIKEQENLIDMMERKKIEFDLLMGDYEELEEDIKELEKYRNDLKCNL